MKKITLSILAVLTFTACTTYHLSTQNLLKQFDSSGVESKGFLFPNAVKGNDLKTFIVQDNKGTDHLLPVSDHTAIRITKKNNKRVQLYFNTIILKDSAITGSKSHFLNIPIPPINFSDITKIEVQK